MQLYAVEGDRIFNAQGGALLRYLALRHLERGVNRATIEACKIIAWANRNEDWRIAGYSSFADWANAVNPFDWGASQAYRAAQIGDLVLNGLYAEEDLGGASFTALREALPVMTRAYGDQDVANAWRAFLSAFFRCNPSTSDVQRLRQSRVDVGWEKIYRAFDGDVGRIIGVFGLERGENAGQLSLQFQRYALISPLVESNEASAAASILHMLVDAPDSALYYLGASPERESAALPVVDDARRSRSPSAGGDADDQPHGDPFVEDRLHLAQAVARVAASSLAAHDNYSVPRVVVSSVGGDWYRVCGDVPVSTLLVLAAHVQLVDEDGNPFRFHDESPNDEEQPCHES